MKPPEAGYSFRGLLFEDQSLFNCQTGLLPIPILGGIGGGFIVVVTAVVEDR